MAEEDSVPGEQQEGTAGSISTQGALERFAQSLPSAYSGDVATGAQKLISKRGFAGARAALTPYSYSPPPEEAQPDADNVFFAGVDTWAGNIAVPIDGGDGGNPYQNAANEYLSMLTPSALRDAVGRRRAVRAEEILSKYRYGDPEEDLTDAQVDEFLAALSVLGVDVPVGDDKLSKNTREELFGTDDVQDIVKEMRRGMHQRSADLGYDDAADYIEFAHMPSQSQRRLALANRVNFGADTASYRSSYTDGEFKATAEELRRRAWLVAGASAWANKDELRAGIVTAFANLAQDEYEGIYRKAKDPQAILRIESIAEAARAKGDAWYNFAARFWSGFVSQIDRWQSIDNEATNVSSLMEGGARRTFNEARAAYKETVAPEERAKDALQVLEFIVSNPTLFQMACNRAGLSGTDADVETFRKKYLEGLREAKANLAEIVARSRVKYQSLSPSEKAEFRDVGFLEATGDIASDWLEGGAGMVGELSLATAARVVSDKLFAAAGTTAVTSLGLTATGAGAPVAVGGVALSGAELLTAALLRLYSELDLARMGADAAFELSEREDWNLSAGQYAAFATASAAVTWATERLEIDTALGKFSPRTKLLLDAKSVAGSLASAKRRDAWGKALAVGKNAAKAFVVTTAVETGGEIFEGLGQGGAGAALQVKNVDGEYVYTGKRIKEDLFGNASDGAFYGSAMVAIQRGLFGVRNLKRADYGNGKQQNIFELEQDMVNALAFEESVREAESAKLDRDVLLDVVRLGGAQNRAKYYKAHGWSRHQIALAENARRYYVLQELELVNELRESEAEGQVVDDAEGRINAVENEMFGSEQGQPAPQGQAKPQVAQEVQAPSAQEAAFQPASPSGVGASLLNLEDGAILNLGGSYEAADDGQGIAPRQVYAVAKRTEDGGVEFSFFYTKPNEAFNADKAQKGVFRLHNLLIEGSNETSGAKPVSSVIVDADGSVRGISAVDEQVYTANKPVGPLVAAAFENYELAKNVDDAVGAIATGIQQAVVGGVQKASVAVGTAVAKEHRKKEDAGEFDETEVGLAERRVAEAKTAVFEAKQALKEAHKRAADARKSHAQDPALRSLLHELTQLRALKTAIERKIGERTPAEKLALKKIQGEIKRVTAGIVAVKANFADLTLRGLKDEIVNAERAIRDALDAEREARAALAEVKALRDAQNREKERAERREQKENANIVAALDEAYKEEDRAEREAQEAYEDAYYEAYREDEAATLEAEIERLDYAIFNLELGIDEPTANDVRELITKLEKKREAALRRFAKMRSPAMANLILARHMAKESARLLAEADTRAKNALAEAQESDAEVVYWKAFITGEVSNAHGGKHSEGAKHRVGFRAWCKARGIDLKNDATANVRLAELQYAEENIRAMEARASAAHAELSRLKAIQTVAREEFEVAQKLLRELEREFAAMSDSQHFVAVAPSGRLFSGTYRVVDASAVGEERQTDAEADSTRDGGSANFPIVSEGGQVLWRGGMKISQAQAAQARAFAKQHGLDIPDGVENPVVVRVVNEATSEVSAERLGQEFERARSYGRGAAKQAIKDAKKLEAALGDKKQFSRTDERDAVFAALVRVLGLKVDRTRLREVVRRYVEANKTLVENGLPISSLEAGHVWVEAFPPHIETNEDRLTEHLKRMLEEGRAGAYVMFALYGGVEAVLDDESRARLQGACLAFLFGKQKAAGGENCLRFLEAVRKSKKGARVYARLCEAALPAFLKWAAGDDAAPSLVAELVGAADLAANATDAAHKAYKAVVDGKGQYKKGERRRPIDIGALCRAYFAENGGAEGMSPTGLQMLYQILAGRSRFGGGGLAPFVSTFCAITRGTERRDDVFYASWDAMTQAFPNGAPVGGTYGPIRGGLLLLAAHNKNASPEDIIATIVTMAEGDMPLGKAPTTEGGSREGDEQGGGGEAPPAPAPQTPQTPQTPQAPQTPQTPQTPQAPQTPQTPQTPTIRPHPRNPDINDSGARGYVTTAQMLAMQQAAEALWTSLAPILRGIASLIECVDEGRPGGRHLKKLLKIKCFDRITKAVEDGPSVGALFEVVDALVNAESNIRMSNRIDGTDLKFGAFSAVQRRLAEHGIEIPSLWETHYEIGMVFSDVDFTDDPSLPVGTMVVRSVRSAHVFLNGKLIKPAKIVVAMGPREGDATSEDIEVAKRIVASAEFGQEPFALLPRTATYGPEYGLVDPATASGDTPKERAKNADKIKAANKKILDELYPKQLAEIFAPYEDALGLPRGEIASKVLSIVDAGAIRDLMAFQIQGNKAVLSAHHRETIALIGLTAIFGQGNQMDLFGGSAGYTLGTGAMGARKEGATLNEWQRDRELTDRWVAEDPDAVFNAASDVARRFFASAEWREFVAKVKAFNAAGGGKEFTGRPADGLVKWIDDELNGRHGGEAYFHKTSVPKGERVFNPKTGQYDVSDIPAGGDIHGLSMKDTARSAGLYLFCQHIVTEHRAVSFEYDAKTGEGRFFVAGNHANSGDLSKSLVDTPKGSLLRRFKLDGAMKGIVADEATRAHLEQTIGVSFKNAEDTLGRLRGYSRNIRGGKVRIIRADGWEIAAEQSMPGDIVFIDPTYVETSSYSTGTNEDVKPSGFENHLAGVVARLMKRGIYDKVSLIVTNNYKIKGESKSARMAEAELERIYLDFATAESAVKGEDGKFHFVRGESGSVPTCSVNIGTREDRIRNRLDIEKGFKNEVMIVSGPAAAILKPSPFEVEHLTGREFGSLTDEEKADAVAGILAMRRKNMPEKMQEGIKAWQKIRRQKSLKAKYSKVRGSAAAGRLMQLIKRAGIWADGVKVRTFESHEEFLAEYECQSGMRALGDGEGGVYGFYNPKTGEVCLSPNADAETVVHEVVWHATYEWARKNSPALYKKMRAFAASQPQELKAEIRKLYPTASEEEYLDELGAAAFSARETARIESAIARIEDEKARKASMSWWGKFKAFVGDVFAKMRAKLGKEQKVDIAEAGTPEQVMDAIADAFVRGEALADVVNTSAKVREERRGDGVRAQRRRSARQQAMQTLRENAVQAAQEARERLGKYPRGYKGLVENGALMLSSMMLRHGVDLNDNKAALGDRSMDVARKLFPEEPDFVLEQMVRGAKKATEELFTTRRDIINQLSGETSSGVYKEMTETLGRQKRWELRNTARRAVDAILQTTYSPEAVAEATEAQRKHEVMKARGRLSGQATQFSKAALVELGVPEFDPMATGEVRDAGGNVHGYWVDAVHAALRGKIEDGGVLLGTLRATLYARLRDVARKVHDSAAAVKATKILENMKANANTLDAVMRAAKEAELAIRTGANKQTALDLVKRINDKTSRFSNIALKKPEKDRRTAGLTEAFFYYFRRGMRMELAEIDARIAELTAKITSGATTFMQGNAGGRLSAFEGDVMILRDVQEREALVLAREYQAAKEAKDAGRLAGVLEAVERRLREGKDSLEARIERAEAEAAAIAETIAAAMEKKGRNKAAKKTGGWLDAIGAQLTGAFSFKQQLEDAIRFCEDPKIREKAQAAIDKLNLAIAKADVLRRSIEGRNAQWLCDTICAIWEKGRALKTATARAKAATLRMAALAVPQEKYARFSADGKTPLSYAQVLQIYSSVRQDDVRQPFAYIEEIEDAEERKKAIAALSDSARQLWKRISQTEELAAAVGAEGIEFLDRCAAKYIEDAPEVDRVAIDIAGVPLTLRNKDYFPISRDFTHINLNSAQGALSYLPTAMTPRIHNKVDIDERVDAFSIWLSRSSNIAHFVAFGEIHMQLGRIIGNEHFSETLRRTQGDRMTQQLADHARDILTPNLTGAELYSTDVAAAKLTQLAAYVALGGNFLVMARQVTSITAFAFDVGWGKNFSAMLSIVRNPAAALRRCRQLVNSEGWRARYRNDEFATQVQILAARGGKRWWRRLLQLYMMPNRLGDSIPVLLVGQGILGATEASLAGKINPETGRIYTQEEAQKAAENVVWDSIEKTQQTSRTANMSHWQRRGGSVSRMLAQFQSTTSQFLGAEVRAWRDAIANPNRRTIGNLGKVIVNNHLVLPGLFTIVGALWRVWLGDDDDDEKFWEDFKSDFIMSCILGPASGVFLFGAILQATYAFVIRNEYQRGMAVPAMSVVNRVGRSVGRVANAATSDKDVDWERELDSLTDNIAFVRDAKDVIQKVSDHMD